MKKPAVEYDEEANAAYIRFSAGEIFESAEVSKDIVLDYDHNGHIVGMEILNAKAKLPPSLLEDAAA